MLKVLGKSDPHKLASVFGDKATATFQIFYKAAPTLC